MKRHSKTRIFVLIAVWVAVFMISTNEVAAQSPTSACDLLTKSEVEKITGFAVTNVVMRDRGSFTSCSFETESWENSTGVIYFPGLKPVANSAALAAEIQKDMERDQASFTKPEPVDGIGDAAAYYASDDGYLHTLVMHKGRNRIIISAKSKKATMELAKAARAPQ